MARPSKCRRISKLPVCNSFKPSNSNGSINITIDEFETIRLIDYLGLSQKEAASVLNVARSTVQLIYDSARKNLSKALVEGLEINISGGNIELNNEFNLFNLEDALDNHLDFIVAIPYSDGKIYDRFGKAKDFVLYYVSNNIVKTTELLNTSTYHAFDLITFLKSKKVDLIICNNIGEKAKNYLKEVKVALIDGITGPTIEIIKSLLNKELNRKDLINNF